ncbi:hypothetical protein CJF31_00011247 [Rutstroemia sp. NJR-2017a BVV2]|nr:hypothetical protein CJF31_00011247 [Rutstroemia sp. NJR-2017a BVV2]
MYFYALVRKQEHADAVKKLGVEPVLFNGLQDTEQIRKISADYDVVINNASAQDAAAAKAFIEGLGDRKAKNSSEVYYIHTAGASSFGDNPITGSYHETRVFSDTDPDIAEYIKKRNEHTEYHQRTTDLTVIETGEAVGVRTYIIMPPLIFGRGTGPFNTISVQIPSMIRGALAAKKSGMLKECTAVWSHVHVQDLAELYKILFTKVFIEKAGEDQVPSGRKGIYFAETGEASWRSVAEEVGKVGKDLGRLETEKLQEIDIQEAANRWTGGSVEYVEAAFLSNSRTRAELSRSLGWKPTRESMWENAVREDYEAILASS